MEWGSVGELVSGVSALGALVAATFAARAAIKTNNQQSRQLDHLEKAELERREAARREQAEMVAAWISLDKTSDLPQVWWANSSARPVYCVTLFLSTPYGTAEARYNFGGPTESRSLPRAQKALLEHPGAARVASWTQLLNDDSFGIAVAFRDSASRWWFRDYTGMLTSHADENSAR